MPVVRRSSAVSAVAAEGAHAAVGVAHAGAEEEVERAGEHRVADVAVQPRHRAGLDAVHAVAHHEVGAVLELGRGSAGSRRSRRSGRRRPSRCSGRGRRRSRPCRRCRSRGGARGRRARRRRSPARRCSSSESLSATTTSPAMPCSAMRGERPGDAALDVLGLVEARDDDADEQLVLACGERTSGSGERRGSAMLMAGQGSYRPLS